MELPDFSLHPIRLLMGLDHIIGPAAILSFSRYQYEPQQVIDRRVTFEMPFQEINEHWLKDQLLKLTSAEDLALDSLVKLGSTVFHLPMIDFVGHSLNHLLTLVDVFGESAKSDFAFYKSGRSFHAYGRSTVLPESDWYKFMGRLLLCNLPSKPAVVDQRWVGHRLMGGFSALRWSNNAPRYKQYPTLISDFGELSGLNGEE